MRKRTAFDWACLVFIILFLCITVFPFVWIIITSFKTDADIHGAATYARKLLGYRYQILNQGRLRSGYGIFPGKNFLSRTRYGRFP